MSMLPLHGIKVIDFGQYIAGPAVAMILADLGATVVHVDPPNGCLWDSPANAILHRNKLCLNLDLKSEQGLKDAHDLIEHADIVIENFRPGVMQKLGIDFASLREKKEELITLAIPGFASNDELRSQWRAFESVIAAQSGVFTDMGLNRVLMGINPSFSPLPLASAYGVVIAASSVVLALQARQRSGIGDGIEVPLASALMEGLCYNSIKIEDYPHRYLSLREQEIERRRVEGLHMNLSYDELQDLLDPFYRSYKCKDGRMFYVVCPSHKHHAKRCLKTLGLYDQLVEEGLGEQEDTYLPTEDWSSKASLGVYPLPKEWADTIAQRMKEVFITRTSKEWERIFGRGRFPGAPHRWLQEWIHDDHASTSGLMLELEDPEHGSMIQPGPMVWLEESGAEMLAPKAAKRVSCKEALATLARLETSLPLPNPKRAKQGWLQGVRILDLCNVIAGPHSVAYLARFGAKVTKVDPAKPLYDCWNTVIFGMSHMRGKRSLLASLNSPEGREVLEALIRNHDVIVWNATNSQVAAMGLEMKQLKSINPKAIFCQLDCFSGPVSGPRSNFLGYDDLVQATTGIATRFGGSMDTPEEHAHVGTIDVMCGFAGAMSVAAALYQKYSTGRIGRPRTSLSALSGLAQLPFCFDFPKRGLFDEPSGQSVMGYDALTRFYYTLSDNYLLLSAYEADLVRLEKVEGLEGISAVPLEERAVFLSSAFGKEQAEVWLERLHEADVAASICENLEKIRQSHCRLADGTPGIDQGSYAFSQYDEHPSGHTVIQVDPFAVRPTTSHISALTPAEKYGHSTRAILQELHFQDERIEQLLEAGVISESWSRQYLPT